MVSFRRLVRGGLILAVSTLAATGLVLAQAPAQGLSFDVASVKAAAPLNPQEIIQTGKIPRVGMTVEGSRVDIGYMSLADLIPIAYNVKPFQVAGPDWLNSERFDIAARIPEGATKEQVPEMLQALLAERFQLKVHREKRDHSVYGLVVAKGGHKLKESPPDAETSAATDDEPKSLGAPFGGISLGNGTQVRVDNRGGAATVISAQNGTMKMSTTPDGQMRLEFSKVTMAQLADMLTRLVDKPVVDMTELKGNYQATLDLALADMLNMASRTAGIAIPALAGARGGNPAAPAQASDPSSNSVFTSVQQLGLRLDSQKAPVDVIVIDRVERTPTEN